MPLSEFMRWQQFYAQEPFDDRADNVLLPQIAAMLANSKRDLKKHRALEGSDFSAALRWQKQQDATASDDEGGLGLNDGW